MNNTFKGAMIDNYTNFIKEYSAMNNSRLNPIQIVRFVSSNLNRFGSSQEDAEQYLNYIIDNLIEELNAFIKNSNMNELKISNKNITLNTLINNVFTINIRKKITCKHCQYESISNEYENRLYLALENNLSLNELMLNYMNEQLNDENKYLCEKCSNHSCASINKEIITCPKYLIITLKRYTNLNSKIDYPIKMQYEVKLNGSNYSLRGFIYHSGVTNGGHYVYYGKVNNNWYLYNDSQTCSINNEQINNLVLYGYIYLYSKI